MKALKAQLSKDFIIEMTTTPPTSDDAWEVFTNRSSNYRKSEAGVILENNCRLMIQVSLRY